MDIWATLLLILVGLLCATALYFIVVCWAKRRQAGQTRPQCPPPLRALLEAGVIGGLLPLPPPEARPWGHRVQAGAEPDALEAGPVLRFVDLREALCAPFGGPRRFLVFRADRASEALVRTLTARAAAVAETSRAEWLEAARAVLGWRSPELEAAPFRVEWFADGSARAFLTTVDDGFPAIYGALQRVLPGLAVKLSPN